MNQMRLAKSSIVCVLVSAGFASCTIEGLPSNTGEPGDGGAAGSDEPDTIEAGTSGMGGKAAGGSNGGDSATAGDSGTAGDSTSGGDGGDGGDGGGLGGSGGDAGQGGAGGEPPHCGDTMTDENNCGTCGHVCSCGKCTDGECQPTVTVATAAYSSSLIAASGTTAYIGHGGALHKFALADTTTKEVATLNAIWGIQVSNDYVYYTGRQGGGSVARAPLAGGAPETVAPAEDWPTGIDVVDNGSTISVFWAAYFAKKIRGKVGAGAAFDVCSTSYSPVMVAASDNRVYLAESTKIHWCDVSPKAEGDLVTGLNGVGLIKRYKDALYWWETNGGGTAGKITKRIIAGGATTTPITGIEPRGMAIDDTSIYYLDGSVIRGARQDGTNKRKLIELANNAIHDLAVDDQCVYWSYGNATIGRIDKD